MPGETQQYRDKIDEAADKARELSVGFKILFTAALALLPLLATGTGWALLQLADHDGRLRVVESKQDGLDKQLDAIDSKLEWIQREMMKRD